MDFKTTFEFVNEWAIGQKLELLKQKEGKAAMWGNDFLQYVLGPKSDLNPDQLYFMMENIEIRRETIFIIPVQSKENFLMMMELLHKAYYTK